MPHQTAHQREQAEKRDSKRARLELKSAEAGEAAEGEDEELGDEDDEEVAAAAAADAAAAAAADGTTTAADENGADTSMADKSGDEGDEAEAGDE